MVRLSKIYTKTGDDGTTALGDGKRTSKAGLRVEAYGTVDEANASIGVCIALCDGEGKEGPAAAIAALLRSIQHDLFDLGADLCVPIGEGEGEGKGKTRLRITPEQTRRLEEAIDLHNEGLKALSSFVLPGGTPLAAALHVARTVVRRAERCVVALMNEEPGATAPETVRYLNRLSDLLFVLGRVANQGGEGEVLWAPGANRPT